MQEEERLVHQAQQGDAGAYGKLYDIHFDKVFRYLYVRCGNRTDAEDLAEEVFLRGWQSINSFRWQGVSYAAWLMRIAHNLLVDHFRKKREPVYLDERPALPPSASPEASVEQRLAVEQVMQATKELTDLQRQVIALRFCAGLSVAETAKAMGKQEGAVKAMQHSAVAAIRRVLNRNKR